MRRGHIGGTAGRLCGLVLLSATALALSASTSQAATIGQASPPASLGACENDVTYVQTSVSSGPGYESTASGVITSWSTYGGPTATTMKLEVLHPDPPGGPTHYIAEQKDSRDVTALNELNTFTGVHLRIAAGEFIGIYNPPAGGYCLSFSVCECASELYRHVSGDPAMGTSADFSTAQTQGLINALAVVEPDADGDGFGDETQDGCPDNAAIHGSCPVSAPTTTAGKKCKKKKKKGSASVAKKCKRKKPK